LRWLKRRSGDTDCFSPLLRLHKALFLIAVFRHNWSLPGSRFGSLLEQNYFAGFYVAELFASFLLNHARVAALQGLHAILKLFVIEFAALDLLLQRLHFRPFALPDLHAIGAEDNLVSNMDRNQGDAYRRHYATHAIEPFSGDANRDPHSIF